jgi:hypothetical protein
VKAEVEVAIFDRLLAGGADKGRVGCHARHPAASAVYVGVRLTEAVNEA